MLGDEHVGYARERIWPEQNPFGLTATRANSYASLQRDLTVETYNDGGREEFVLEIPPLRPGSVEHQAAEHTGALESAYFHLVERAELRGAPAAEIAAGLRAFDRVRQRVFAKALVRLRRAHAPTVEIVHRRAPSRARRARSRRRAVRRAAGRSGGSDDGPGGDPDPPRLGPASAAEVGHA